TNILEGALTQQDGKSILKMDGEPPFEVNSDQTGAVKFVVRPEKLLLTSEPVSDRVCLSVIVADEIFLGRVTNGVVDYKGHPLTVVEQNSRVTQEKARFTRGDSAYLSWNPKHTVVLEK